MPPAVASEMTAATTSACEQALVVVHGALGIGPATVDGDALATADLEERFYQRVFEQAQILASAGWVPAMLKVCVPMLATSPELDDKVRYGRPLSAADFERVRRVGLVEARQQLDDGQGTVVERVVTTRTGFALKVAAAKLYTAREMTELWRAAGSPGCNCCLSGDRDDAMFTAVETPDGRRFQLR